MIFILLMIPSHYNTHLPLWNMAGLCINDGTGRLKHVDLNLRPLRCKASESAPVSPSFVRMLILKRVCL